MDFEKRNFKNLRGVIALVVLTLSVAASTNIDCKGKAFHCVNSTHFMICVDVGSGLSSTIDNFVIPCPPTTECLPNNRFECEFPPATSPQPIHEPLESTTQAAVVDTTTVIFQHNTLPDTESPQNVSETIIDNYFNTVSPTTVSTSASTINEEASLSSGKDVTFETLSTTGVLRQNYIDIVPNNITTTAPNIVTSSDVTTNELPLQNSSVNEITTVVNNNMVDSTTETVVPLITEVAFLSTENNSTSKAIITTDGSTQSYSDIVPNNITTTAPNIVTSSDVTTNELPLQNSSVNEITTMVDNNMVDSTTETIVPSVSEVAFVSIDYNATSKAIITTDGSTQNYSDIVPNNITTTVPNIVTSSDVTTNELPLQNSKVNEITTMVDNNMVDSTTETIVPSVSEVAFVSIDYNATSKAIITTDGSTQNYSDIVPNNITTTVPNIVTSSDVTTNELPLLNSKVNEITTMVDNNMVDSTTETIVPSVSEVAFVSIDYNATSKAIITTDGSTQNYSDIVPNNITTTVPNIVTSSDVTPNELPLLNSKVNEITTMVDNNMVDSTTETIVPSVSEVAFVSIDYNATSKAIITTDGSTQHYSDIVPNNITTTVPNIVTSSDVTPNELPLQNSSVNEGPTMMDITTETMVPSITEVAFVGIENNATSKTLFITDVPTQNYSDIVPNNITTTVPNIVTSSDVITNELPLQNSSVNEGPTMMDITTETMVPSITEVAFVGIENNATSKTLFIIDVPTQNYSDLVPNNITTTAPNIVTSSDVTTNERQLQNSSVNEGLTVTDITTETMVPSITEVAFVSIENNTTTKTLITTDGSTQNYSDIVPNNITTTVPNIVTSSDVTTNELPLQNSSANEKPTVVDNNMVDSTTETMVPSVSEVAFVSIDYNATSKAIITTDGSTQHYSDIVPNNITTTVPNIVTSSDVTPNELPLQNSSVNEGPTMMDITTETMVPSITEVAFVGIENNATSKTLFITDVPTQNYSDIVPNNITTTVPNIVTSSDVITNELPLQNSSVNEGPTMMDITTETMVPSITEVAFVGIENNATSKTLFIIDVPTQNYSDLVPNNITTTAPNIVTSSDVTTNERQLQNSSVNEGLTVTDITTETMVPSITEVAFVSIENNTTTKTLITTDGSTQNYSDIVPNNITTTVPNIVTSSDVTTNELPLQNSSANEKPTVVNNNMLDSTTETMVPSVSEVAFVSIENNATSKTLFITDVPTQNYFDIEQNNITTTAPNIVTSSDVTTNELPLQNLSVNEITTVVNNNMVDSTTETMVPSITEVAFVGIENNATSKTLCIIDVPTQNYSDLVPNNITTTVPNIVTSSDVTTNELPLQNSSVNEGPTMMDITTETMVPSITEVAFVGIENNATSKTLFIIDVPTQNYSDLVPNNITTTAPNIVTSSDVTTNELQLQNSSVNEGPTMMDITTETMVPSITEVAFVSIENNATSKILITTESSTQNHSDIIQNNITTTAPNIVTSSDVTTNERQLQNSSVNEKPTVVNNNMVDSTTETMVPSVSEVAFVSIENNATSKILITTEGSTQNYSDIVPNNITTTAPNIVTSSDVTTNERQLQNSSVNESPTVTDITTETMVPSITEVAFVSIENNATSKILITTESSTQNHSDIIQNNITTTAPNIVTSSDVTTNERQLQNSSVNEKPTVVNNNMVDSTTETMVPSVSEVAFVSIENNATSKILITTDGSTQNYSDIVPNNITTTVPNVVTSSDVTTNELPLQNSSVNEITTVVNNNMVDSTTETMVPSITEVAFVSIENNATSKILITTESSTQNHSDIIQNNITTTAPNIVTSSDVTTNERQLQNSSVNEKPTVVNNNMVDSTTETMVPSVSEVAFVSIENNATSKILITTEGSTQNYSDIVPNNITTTAPNIVTSSDVTTNERQLQNSSVNESPTVTDITTETMVPSITEVAFVSIENNATSKILITTESSTQNHSDIIQNNITTTAPNIVTSSDVTTNERQLQNSSVNESPTVTDITTETMVPSITEVAFVSIENNATSKILITTESSTQNHSDIIQNNITTTAPNIVTSSDVTTNERQLQNSSVNEKPTVVNNNMVDSTTETMVPSVSEVAFVSIENNATSKILITTDGSTQNYSDIVPNNITTTVPNVVTSSDVTTNELPLQNSSVNEKPTVVNNNLVDSTTETMVPSVYEVAFVSIENNATSKTLFITDVPTQNYSDIEQNNITTTAPNIVTSSDVTTNDRQLQNSSVNEITTVADNNMVDSTTETMVPSVSEVAFVSIENNATSKILITTEGSTQNYSDIVPNNIMTTVPNIVTSSDVTTNELPLQNSSINEKPTVNNPWLINIESDNSKTYSTTNGDPSKITVSEKGYSSVAMSSPTEGYVAHIETHDVVLTHNTNKKHTQNQSVTYTETQSNIRVKNIANNTSHDSKHKSSDNRHTNTYNTRKTTFSCRLRSRGKYADSMDCRKFYICIGREQPIVGMCPIDTVFSEIRKQCTSNLSHCIRNNQFHCASEGRFSDFLQNDIYYICIKGRADAYVRFKLQCQNGYYLNKTSVHCSPRVKETSQPVSSISDSSSTNSDQSATTSSSSSSSDDSSRSESTVERNDFQCKEEGRFADPNNCRRYYVCSKSSKLGYKIKRKSCDDDKIFNKDKKKCIDNDSLEC